MARADLYWVGPRFMSIGLIARDAVEDTAHDGHQDAAHKCRAKACNGDACTQQVDRQVAGELVIKEIKNPDGTVTKKLVPDGDE